MKGLYLISITFSLFIAKSTGIENGAPGVNGQTAADLRIQLENEKLERLRLEVRVDALVAEIGNHQTGVSTKKKAIGFTAARSSHHNVIGHTPLLYDHVFTNMGNAYNKATGKFTAPVHGIYNFFFKNLSRGDRTLKMDLIVDNGSQKTVIVSAESYGTATRDSTGSASCIVQLAAGNEVHIQTHANNYIFGNYWSTFTGFLVTEM